MAIAIVLAKVGRNRIRYLMSSTSTGADTGTINTIGGTSTGSVPDLLTDLLSGVQGGGGTQVLPAAGNQGPLVNLAKVVAQGFGQFASGVQTQAKARALWMSDRSGANPGTNLPTARCQICPVVQGVGSGWRIDANVDGGGNPILQVSSLGVGVDVAQGEAYLDIFIGDTIGE